MSIVKAWTLRYLTTYIRHIYNQTSNTPTTHAVSSSLHALQIRLPSFDFQQFDSAFAPKHIQSLVADAYYDFVMNQLKNGDLSARQRSVLSCLQAAHAHDFLLTVLIQGLGLSMSYVEYRAVLRYRLQIPLYPGDEQCPLCQSAPLDALGDHAAHCATKPGYKFRHDHVRDALFSIISRAGIKAMKEAPVGFLGDHSHIQRPADILLFDWNEGKHACVDLTGVSPRVARACLPLPGKVASDAVEAKVKKHKAPCEMNNHIFIPFAFDRFGFWLLTRLHFCVAYNMFLNVIWPCEYPPLLTMFFGRWVLLYKKLLRHSSLRGCLNGVSYDFSGVSYNFVVITPSFSH